jgi:hypothetical protein
MEKHHHPLLLLHFSCLVVLGTLAALGHLPVDVLVGRLDVARLAVDAAAVCVSKKVRKERGEEKGLTSAH